MGLSGFYDGIPETALYKILFCKRQRKADNKTREKLVCFNVDLKQHENKIPHQNIIPKCHTLVTDTKTSFFCVRIPYFFERSSLKNGDVLWGRFDQSFFRVWGRFDQFGDVLTKGRFD